MIRTINCKAILFSFLLLMSGCFSQHRLDFDRDQLALVSCDERIKIKHINVRAVGDEGIGYEIKIKGEKSGSNVIYLERPNKDYYVNDDDFEFEPNKEYIITSTQGDSSLEMRIFTDSNGRVDSVSNEFKCLN